MTKIQLLTALKAFTEEKVQDILMPVRIQKDGESATERPASVYLMRLSDSKAATKKAPYIIHQVITSQDIQAGGNAAESTVHIRTVFCVYNEDESEGAMMLLNLMERVRIALLQKVIIGGQFALSLTSGLETLTYPDDTAPYYAGEMSTVWTVPAVQREYRQWLE